MAVTPYEDLIREAIEYDFTEKQGRFLVMLALWIMDKQSEPGQRKPPAREGETWTS